MNQFEYQITLHTAEAFREVVYFCSSEGSCELKEVPSDQIGRLEQILHEQGRKGWELVQTVFGKQGMMIIWKKAVDRAQTASGG